MMAVTVMAKMACIVFVSAYLARGSQLIRMEVTNDGSALPGATCEEWCPSHASKWPEKCTWPKCSTCSGCSADFSEDAIMAAAVHAFNADAVESKSQPTVVFGADTTKAQPAAPLAEPAGATCEDWCAMHTSQWPEKCVWPKCSTCSGCAKPFAMAALDNSPELPIVVKIALPTEAASVQHPAEVLLAGVASGATTPAEATAGPAAPAISAAGAACEDWCAMHTSKWLTKCTWSKCSACSGCFADFSKDAKSAVTKAAQTHTAVAAPAASGAAPAPSEATARPAAPAATQTGGASTAVAQNPTGEASPGVVGAARNASAAPAGGAGKTSVPAGFTADKAAAARVIADQAAPKAADAKVAAATNFEETHAVETAVQKATTTSTAANPTTTTSTAANPTTTTSTAANPTTTTAAGLPCVAACTESPKPWETKCQWVKRCKGCPACLAKTTVTTTQVTTTQANETDAENSSNDTATENITIKTHNASKFPCQDWCAGYDKKNWSVKCTWAKKCKGCPECAAASASSGQYVLGAKGGECPAGYIDIAEADECEAAVESLTNVSTLVTNNKGEHNEIAWISKLEKPGPVCKCTQQGNCGMADTRGSNGHYVCEKEPKKPAAPPSPFPCTDWCAEFPKPWKTKCSMDKCRGCAPCCEASCTKTDANWDLKCSWAKCTGCKACAKIPSATPSGKVELPEEAARIVSAALSRGVTPGEVSASLEHMRQALAPNRWRKKQPNVTEPPVEDPKAPDSNHSLDFEVDPKQDGSAFGGGDDAAEAKNADSDEDYLKWTIER